MKLRVGILGLGEAWEQRHRPALRTLADRFEVHAVYDQVTHRAELAAQAFGASLCEGFRALIAREDVDAVLMLGPQWFGSSPVFAACESGKAVYCAAGLDFDPDEAQKVRRCVEESGIAFMAEFPRRQTPATIRLKELIVTQLGTPRLLFCHQRSPAKTRSNHHVWPPQSPAIRDLIELVDWCCYVVGWTPTAVTGVTHRQGAQGEEDYQMMSLDFSDPKHPGTGPVAQISCGRYIPASWQEAITYRPLAALQVSCERGIAFIDLPSTVVWFDEAGRHQESLDSERPVGEQLLTQFHRSVTSLVRKTSDLEEAYRALSVVHQARQSQVDGRRIRLMR